MESSTEQSWPQPIETAPKDGRPILTDCGIAMWMHQEYIPYKQPGIAGWVSPRMLDDCRYWLEPTLWMPLPEWIDNFEE